LSLPIAVRTVRPQEAGPFTGRTRDISARGVYFVINRELPPGSEVEFTLTLPADVLVRVEGRVVRTEKKRENEIERIGVGAVIVRYNYRAGGVQLALSSPRS
jgi:PilZ domain